MDYFPLTHSLVINQTPDLQDQVADLLAALRRQRQNEKAGVAEQVAGLLKACRLAAEAGDTVHAADLARQAFALDPERVAADPLVYKMHLLTTSGPKCKPRCGRECPDNPEAEEVLPPPTEEAEPPQALRPCLPAVDPQVVSALDALLPECKVVPVIQEVEGPPCASGTEREANPSPPSFAARELAAALVGWHGDTEFDVDLLEGTLRVLCDLRCCGKVYHVVFRNGCLALWTTPDASVPTVEDPR